MNAAGPINPSLGLIPPQCSVALEKMTPIRRLCVCVCIWKVLLIIYGTTDNACFHSLASIVATLIVKLLVESYCIGVYLLWHESGNKDCLLAWGIFIHLMGSVSAVLLLPVHASNCLG